MGWGRDLNLRDQHTLFKPQPEIVSDLSEAPHKPDTRVIVSAPRFDIPRGVGSWSQLSTGAALFIFAAAPKWAGRCIQSDKRESPELCRSCRSRDEESTRVR